MLAGYSPFVVMALLVALFFLMHYVFAGITAHTTAVAPVMLAAGAAVDGMPVRTFVLLLGFSLGIMGVLTPYATGPAPLYYGCGFIARRDFWRLGLHLRDAVPRRAARPSACRGCRPSTALTVTAPAPRPLRAVRPGR